MFHFHCRLVQLFGKFPDLFVTNFQLNSIVVKKSIFYMIPIILNLLRSVLWPRIWFILVTVPCILGKKVYFCCRQTKGYITANQATLSTWSINDLERNAKVSEYICGLYSISPFNAISFCFMCFWAFVQAHVHLSLLRFLGHFPLYYYVLSHFISDNFSLY